MEGIGQVEIDPEFQGITTNFTAAGTSRTDWTDDRLIKVKGYLLPELDEDEMFNLAKDTFKKLETGISEQDLVKVLTLAWNALMPGKKFLRIFPEGSPCMNILDSVDPATADKDIITSTGATSNISWVGNKLVICQAAGYTCLTLIRLATKSAKNYSANQLKIRNRFSDHYEKSYPIAPFSVKDQVINNISVLLQNRLIFKESIAAFLYHARDSKEAQGIINSTYAMHLRDTGMRSWGLFKENAQLLNADSGILLTVLKIESTVKAIRCMFNIIKNFECGEEDLKISKRDRKTYTYARIYDNEAFLDLQSKNCIPLMLILALLNKKLNPKGSGDVMSIEAIKGVDEDVKKIYSDFALAIYEYFHKSEGSAMGNKIFKYSIQKNLPQSSTPSAQSSITQPAAPITTAQQNQQPINQTPTVQTSSTTPQPPQG